MEKAFQEWGIVELFGHQKLAGRISEQSIGGCSFVRIDVPETKRAPAFTKIQGQGSIYGMTITDEKTARIQAELLTPEPIDRWSIDRYLNALPDSQHENEHDCGGYGEEGDDD